MENANILPEKSSNFKWLVIGLTVLAVGLIAYLLAGTKLFKGELKLAEKIKVSDEQMEHVKNFVTVSKPGADAEKFVNWPLESAKESRFEVSEKAATNVVFFNVKGYGHWRVLHADFLVTRDAQKGEFYVNDQSSAQNTAINKWCVKVQDLTGQTVKNECKNTNEIFTFQENNFAAGTYKIILSVEDSDGRTDRTEQIINLEGQPAPTPNITISPKCSVTVTGNTAIFKDETEAFQDGNKIALDPKTWYWEWNFGDGGQESKEQNPTHQYQQSETNQTYNAKLTVTYMPSKKNETTYCSAIIKGTKIEGVPPASLNPKFKYDAKFGKEGLEVNFYNLSTANDTALTKVEWDFGDGKTKTIEGNDLTISDDNGDGIYGDIDHIFAYPEGNGVEDAYTKNYTVKLTASNGQISKQSTAQTVEVKKPVKADFTCREGEGGQFSFTDESTVTSGELKSVKIIDKNNNDTEQTMLPPFSDSNNTFTLVAITDKPYKIHYIAKTDLVDDRLVIDDLSAWCKSHSPVAGNANTMLNTAPMLLNNNYNTLSQPSGSALRLLGNSILHIDAANLKTEVPTPIGADSKKEYEEFQEIKTLFSDLTTKMAAVMKFFDDSTSFNGVVTPSGSTVYFESSCKARKNAVYITPKLFQGQYDFDTMTAFLDIFENDQTCTDTQPQNPPPAQNPLKAVCTVNATGGDTDTVFTFSGKDSTGPITTGAWDFGDTSPNIEFKPDDDNTKTVSHTYPAAGSYTTTLTIRDNDNHQDICTFNIYVKAKEGTATTPQPTIKPQCSDGIDNDKDGYTDIGQDPGCDNSDDNNEYNDPIKIATQCSDGKDNDNDKLTDLKDPGCEDAQDNDETNKEEVVKKGKAKLPSCLMIVKPQDFTDINPVGNKTIITAESGTAYDGEDDDLVGRIIFEGYPEDGERVFRPYSPIRRDEAVKTALITTCYMDQLIKKDKLNKEPIDFNDVEFEDSDYWAADYIYMATHAGLVEEKNKFYPENEVTRAEFLKLLMEIYADINNIEIPECAKDKDTDFVDVDHSDWYCKYALLAQELGISEGFEDKKGNLRLNPNKVLTRTDAAIMLWNYYVATTGKGFMEEETPIKVPK